MENLLKAIFITSLMSGTFMTSAMDTDEKREAEQRGMTILEYRQALSLEQQYFVSKPAAVSKAPAQEEPSDDELERAMADSLGLSVPQYRKLMTEQRDAELARKLALEEQGKRNLYTHRFVEERQNKEEAASIALAIKLQETERKEAESARYLQKLRADEEIRRAEEAKHERLRREEAATEEYFRSLRIEEERRQSEEIRRKDGEVATQKLIREMQAEYEAEVQRRHQEESSFILQVNEKSKTFSSGPHRPTLVRYIQIRKYLNSIAPDSDVHILDNYVYKAENNIKHLITIGNLYNIDDPTLSLSEVGKQMITFASEHADLFSTFEYNSEKVALGKIIEYLNGHFSNMDKEIINFRNRDGTISSCPEAREIWSRAWTLALKLYNATKDFKCMEIIFQEAIEGHMTAGGCIPGRIDRGFVGYVSLLGEAGVCLY